MFFFVHCSGFLAIIVAGVWAAPPLWQTHWQIWLMVTTRQGLCFGPTVQHKMVTTLHLWITVVFPRYLVRQRCAPCLLWSSRWCSAVCSGASSWSCSGACIWWLCTPTSTWCTWLSWWCSPAWQCAGRQPTVDDATDPLMEENCTLLSHSLALVRFLRQFSARDPER